MLARLWIVGLSGCRGRGVGAVLLLGAILACGEDAVGEAGPLFAAAVSTASGAFERRWKRLERVPATERRPFFDAPSGDRELGADCARSMSVWRIN